MSDTPRTDANEVESSDFSDWVSGPSGYVYTDFARTLERELSAAQARIAELEKENAAQQHDIERLLESLHAEIKGGKPCSEA